MPKLTKRFIDALKPTDRDIVHWDDELKGFGLRQKPSGVRTFVVQYRNDQGTSRRVTLGSYGQLTPAQARDKGQAKLGEVRMGVDVAQVRQERRAERTFRDLATEYLAAAEAGLVLTRLGKAKSSSTIATDRGRIDGHLLPLLGNLRLSELSRGELQKAVDAIARGDTAADRPSGKARGRTIITGGAGTAARTAGLLGGILTWAVDRGYLASTPHVNIRRAKSGRRTVADPVELYRALGSALQLVERDGEQWQAVLIVRLAALTGLRKQEIVGLRWSEVDFGGRALRLSASKTGSSVRPLAAPAAELLERVRLANHPGEHVFPGVRQGGAPFGGLPGAIDRLKSHGDLAADDREALAGFTLHLLRHGAATLGSEIGMGEASIAHILGHSRGTVTAGYISRVDRVALAEADRLAERIEAEMAGATANVVRLATSPARA